MPKKKQTPKFYVRKDGLHEAIRTINGKRIAFRGKTDAEVEQRMIAYKGEIERGRLFKSVAEEWWDEHKESLTTNTQGSYRPAYRRAIEAFGDDPLRRITPRDINLFLTRFSRQYTSDKVCRTQLMVINLIFKYGIVNGDCDTNPARDVSVPKNLKKRKRELPTDEQTKLVQQSLNHKFGLFAYFLLYTGCRRGEALALRFGDIDRRNMLIHITKSLCWYNNAPYIKSPKTEAGKRDIILLDKLDAVIPKGKKNDLLFPDEDGELYSGTRFQRDWKNYSEATGVNITPHQLRHAYATILFEAGVSVKDAQDLLGHSTAAMTQDIYTHLRGSRKQQTAELLNSKIENII